MSEMTESQTQQKSKSSTTPKPSTLANMVVTLTIITMVSGGVLGFVYEITKKPIALAKTQKKMAALRKVLPDFDNKPHLEMKKFSSKDPKYSYEIYPASKNNQFVGVAVRSFSKNGFSGLVWVMVGIDATGKVHNTAVLEHKETPGLGTKIADIRFTQQFQGKNRQNFKFQVKQDGGDVDGITAATISSRAFAEGVDNALGAYRDFQKRNGSRNSDKTKNLNHQKGQ